MKKRNEKENRGMFKRKRRKSIDDRSKKKGKEAERKKNVKERLEKKDLVKEQKTAGRRNDGQSLIKAENEQRS